MVGSVAQGIERRVSSAATSGTVRGLEKLWPLVHSKLTSDGMKARECRGQACLRDVLWACPGCVCRCWGAALERFCVRVVKSTRDAQPRVNEAVDEHRRRRTVMTAAKRLLIADACPASIPISLTSGFQRYERLTFRQRAVRQKCSRLRVGGVAPRQQRGEAVPARRKSDTNFDGAPDPLQSVS
jgi:hypothetical protein